MKRLLGILGAGVFLALSFIGSASAQQVNLYCWVDNGPPVHWAPCSSTNQLQISGSFSAAGFPTVQSTGTPISVTTGGVTGTLPAGTVVVASNVGATNGAYCKLGASATTSDQLIPPNSWFAFTVGANTQLTCITSTSTTTVNMVGGSGLPTGSGGGGGGSGGATNVTQVGGVNVPTGGGLQSGALPVDESTSSQFHADLTSAIAAGTNIIGKVGIDQTTPGTTNGVQINAGAAAIGSVFGPTAVGSANANPPVVMGGTATGAAGANVQGVSVVATSVAPVTATNTAVVVDLRPDSPGIITLGPAAVASSVPQTLSSQYPTNNVTTTPTAVTASTTGTTAATAASLAATASVTNYVCGFDITADATALATGTAVLSGTISGSLSYLQTVQAVASGTSILSRTFNPCIPASAANTAITITSAAAGTGGNTIVNIFGYRL